MISVPSLFRPLVAAREFFTLRAAEERSRALTPDQRERVARHVRAGQERLLAGRRTSGAVAACVLLKDAVLQLLRALEAERDPDVDDEGLRYRDVRLPPLPPDPARPRADPSDDARVREALASEDTLFFDRLSPEDAERARWALDRAAGMLRGRVETRSPDAVRFTRWGRTAAVVLVVLWVLGSYARAKLSPQNVALGKPVHPSSQKAVPSDGQTITDGDTGTSFGVHTNIEDNANVVIDLEGLYWVSTIKVYNRMDGWFDDCLPLVVEVSQDGKAFTEVATRDTHFGTSPPWIVDAGGRPARYVRVRANKRGYVALSEVEVFGKKQ